MGVKYVKDFEFPAQAGFHSSNMPARAGMSSKGMPSRAKPNAPARGAARMESPPKMGKGQGYADGGTVELKDRVKIQGRNQAEIKAAMARADAQRKAFEAARREEAAKRKAEVAARNAAKKASPKSVSKDFVPKTFQQVEIPSPKSVSKDYGSSMAPTTIEIPIPAPKKSSYGKYGMQEYAKGGKVAKVMREYKAGKLHSGSKKGPMVKNPKQAMAIALSEARKSGEKVKKLARGGPTSREATGPTSGRATYIPNPFGKSIKVYTGPTGGKQPRVPSRNPSDIFGSENPNFSQALREAEETRALEEMRMNREPVRKAHGGKVGKYAMGGAVDNYAGKTGPYRGSPKKAKMLGRQDRRAREAMERAEKHAPGRSIDMPDRKAHGGMMRRKVA